MIHRLIALTILSLILAGCNFLSFETEPTAEELYDLPAINLDI